MRFEVSRVLDAIERQLSTDPVVARGVVDLGEVIRLADLDGGRPASLLRLGQVIDALARHLGEDGVAVYVVVGRPLLSDAELSSNERMVIRRWADDGLVEALPEAGDRVFEVAELTGLPVLTRRDPGRWLAPKPGSGGAVLVGTAGIGAASQHPMLSRLWRCPQPECPAFGRPAGQPPPRLRAGVPTCPRHGHRLTDAGPRPAAVPMVVRVDGVVRQRFAVTERPVVVGREPTEPDSVRIGPWLNDEQLHWISRSHLVVALTQTGVELTDTSTNGTVVHVRTDPQGQSDPHQGDAVRLSRGERRVLGEHDMAELFDGVQLARPGRWRADGPAQPGSVMADAPTMALRLLR
ncbi:MAG TPA: FHA domain-containing protein [Micromonosporaceae bacterium]|nr:FHA domain-containing protein [Micromonosporaceae bacterium]